MKEVDFKRRYYSKGFTLIELLVVLAIIAILSTIGLLNYGGLVGKARDSSRRTYVSEITTALEVNKISDSYQPLQANQLALYSIDPGGNVYCVAPDSSIPDPSFSVPWESTCPAGFEAVAAGVPTTGPFTSFKVCTYLEQPSSGQPNVYCKSGTL